MISLGILTYSSLVPTGTFKFQITTTVINQVLTLPLGTSGSYVFNFVAKWGDGSADSTIITYDDANRIHTYASIGTYDVELIGTCEVFAFNNTGTSRSLLKKLLAFTENMGFKILNFNGCANLNTIVALGSLTSLTTAESMFRNCTSLISIPSGLFDGCIVISTFFQTFFTCSTLTSIPTDLFRYNILATDFSSVFFSCTGLTSIPIDLFRYNILANTFHQAFTGITGLTSIPTDLFRYNPLVTACSHIFRNCSGLTSIPTDLFRYNPAVTDFSSTFQSCTGLTSIPTDLFRYNVAVTTFNQTYRSCTGLTSIPTDLFRYNILATDFSSTLRALSNLTSIPVNLFRYNTLVTIFSSTFNGCLKAQYNINIFYATGEEGTRFLNKSVNFTDCFTRTSFTGIQGVAPDLWNCNFGSGTPTKTRCYSGAGNSLTSLSNYASIPTAWKT